MSNKELLTKDFVDKVLAVVGDIDNAILLPCDSDIDYLFFDPSSNKVTEVSFKGVNFNFHDYYFNNHMASCIKKTKRDNRFICVDWVANELSVLTYKIDQYGIKNYIIKELPYKPLDDEEDLYSLHELIFSDLADCSTFEVYFQHLFHDHDDKEINKMLIKNKLLD
jgi:hypothetical protein